MAQNFIYSGETLDYANGGSAITAGSPVVVGSAVGVALGDIAATTGTGTLATEGVWELAKTNPLAIAQGDQVYWSTSTNKVTKTATDKYLGTAWVAAGSTDATVQVKLAPDATKIAATVAANATADGSDAATTQALANSLKTTVNDILTSLKDAGIMA